MLETPLQSRKRFGEIFRAKREEMHLSLKEVENATSVRTMYLQAIEEGHIDQLLSSVYALGFIKQYANFLGFDGQKIVDDNREIFQLSKPKLEVPYGLGTMNTRGLPHLSHKNRSNLFWVGIGGAMLLGAWIFARLLGLF